MSVRLKSFRSDPRQSYRFLSQTAFDKNQDLRTRWRALTTMGRLDPEYFKKDIEKALTSSEWHSRNAALIAVLNAPRELALKWSVAGLKDPSLMVRTQAVRNLVGLNAIEAQPLLWNALWDRRNFRDKESLWVRAHIAEALARLATRGDPRSFERLLLDPDWRLHRWAILGLEKTTGIKLSSRQESVEVQREKWLARLGVNAI